MKLLRKDDIHLYEEISCRSEVFLKIAEYVMKSGRITDQAQFCNELKKREEESSTGFGNHVAIPHCQSEIVKEAGIIILRNNKEIEWNSIDELPVNVFICLFVPAKDSSLHLKMLSKLARKLIHEEFIDILKKKNEEEILKEVNAILEGD